MNENEHTPEPWRTGSPRHPFAADEDVVGRTDKGDDFILARCNYNFPEVSRVNSRRIVACVNACLGISTETLERPGFTIMGNTEELGNERDQFRALLEEALEISESMAFKTRIREALKTKTSFRDPAFIATPCRHGMSFIEEFCPHCGARPFIRESALDDRGYGTNRAVCSICKLPERI